jgi:AraC-like DNA-binding protein
MMMETDFAENLAHRLDARASCSVMPSIGDGYQDINYILRCQEPWEDGLWCDTYDGLNQAGIDWWDVHWSEPVRCNVLQFRQGPMTDSGGWWHSLGVEYQRHPADSWHPVTNLQIIPEYDFKDRRGNRMPYERFTLTYDPIKCTGLRMIGTPGGLAQHTKIAQISIFERDLSFWYPPHKDPAPRPRLLELLSPHEVFHLLARFYPVCDILFTLMINRLNLIYFLDEDHYAEWKNISRFSADPTDFWRRIYDREGARRWYELTQRLIEQAGREHRAVTGIREDGLAQIVAPLIVDGKILGVLRNASMVRISPFDRKKQLAYIRQIGLDEVRFLEEIDQIPYVSQEKLVAIGAFLESIANTLRDLYLQNKRLKELRSGGQGAKSIERNRAMVILEAVDYMRQHLEDPICITALADRFSLSPGHFSRLFRKQTGRSPKQYLIDMRIERACYLLRSGKVSVAEACSAIGYDSITSFTRLFKQRTGKTPAQYTMGNSDSRG